MLVIDPPYVTEDVWSQYSVAIDFLLKSGGRLILSTLDENAGFIKSMTGCTTIKFRPYIPNLIYQFSFYANYEDTALEEVNGEIPVGVSPEEEERRVLKILGLDFS